MYEHNGVSGIKLANQNVLDSQNLVSLWLIEQYHMIYAILSSIYDMSVAITKELERTPQLDYTENPNIRQTTQTQSMDTCQQSQLS